MPMSQPAIKVTMTVQIAMLAPSALLAWAAMPAGLNEFFGLTLHRAVADLRYCTQARIMANVGTIGDTAAVLAGQYSLDSGSTWNYLDQSAGPSVGIATTGLRVGAWVNVTNAALVESCWLRVAGSAGNGIASPTIGRVALEFR